MTALGIMLYHFFFAFLPDYLRYTPPSGLSGSLVGSPLLVFVNGKAFVIILLVLSGYVLSLKGLRPGADTLLAEAVLKRWFRFAPLICLSLLLSYLLFRFHLYHYEDAYALGHVAWLHNYGGLSQTFEPSVSEVLYDGLFGSLLHGNDRFDAVLWTMQIEFFGSLIVFALAFLLAPARRFWFWPTFGLTAFLLFQEGIWFFPFLVGLLGVALRLENIKLGVLATVLLLAAGLYLCGYYYPVGTYGLFAGIPLPEMKLRLLIFCIGAFALLTVFATHNIISSQFNGFLLLSSWQNILFPLSAAHPNPCFFFHLGLCFGTRAMARRPGRGNCFLHHYTAAGMGFSPHLMHGGCAFSPAGIRWQKKARHEEVFQAAFSRNFSSPPFSAGSSVFVAASYIRFVHYTSRRVYDIHPDYAPYGSGEMVCVVAFWHARLLMMPMLNPPRRKMNVLISTHRDGEMIARTMHRFRLQHDTWIEHARRKGRGKPVGQSPAGGPECFGNARWPQRPPHESAAGPARHRQDGGRSHRADDVFRYPPPPHAQLGSFLAAAAFWHAVLQHWRANGRRHGRGA